MRRASKQKTQAELAFPAGWGGKRTGAGRKPRRGRRKVPHRSRQAFASRFPVHVTVRMADDVPRLRRFRMMRILARAFVLGCRRDGDNWFRICQFSIQGNHIHLICEASGAPALGRGMQAFKVRVTRAINKHLGGRTGSVFDDRYHVEVLTSPRQVRNALCYVLQNARRHGVHRHRAQGWVDPYSSARYFTGWSAPVTLPPAEAGADPPVAPARGWLLSTGWKRWGLIEPGEIPAAGREP